MKVVLTEEEWNALKNEPVRQLVAVKTALINALCETIPFELNHQRFPGDPDFSRVRADNLKIAMKDVLQSLQGRRFSGPKEAEDFILKAKCQYVHVRDMITKVIDDAINPRHDIVAINNNTNEKP